MRLNQPYLIDLVWFDLCQSELHVLLVPEGSLVNIAWREAFGTVNLSSDL